MRLICVQPLRFHQLSSELETNNRCI